jgi:hypothetical protein
MPTTKRLFRVVVAIAVPVLVFGGAVLMEMSAARPPRDLRTIEEFQEWKAGSIVGSGTFQNSGVKYRVMLAPAGRFWPSGPAAYLFDEQGRFVDWTADMGDFSTVKNGFELNGGGFVRDSARETP